MATGGRRPPGPSPSAAAARWRPRTSRQNASDAAGAVVASVLPMQFCSRGACRRRHERLHGGARRLRRRCACGSALAAESGAVVGRAAAGAAAIAFAVKARGADAAGVIAVCGWIGASSGLRRSAGALTQSRGRCARSLQHDWWTGFSSN